ncbi:sensor histidine kinase N-terminal domain-containing protein [Undibacterium sp. SXout7W]|uniref:sensor histidine kinase N-terminal domain-containing protein n=1 Tax=Undibacterium sp. SXout7W TaxID=3413049 RepID=UPI003BF3D9CC
MKPFQPSIRQTLLRWLIVPLLFVNLMGGGLVYWLAWAPAQIAFDQSLSDTCWALSTRLKREEGIVQVDLPSAIEQILRVDHFNTIYFVIRNQAGKTLAGDKDFPMLAIPSRFDEPQLTDGRMRGEEIRIVSIKFVVGDEPVVINAAETLTKRHAIRSRIIIALAMIEVVLTALLLIISWVAVTKGLMPLKKIQTDLNQRNFEELSAISVEENTLELGAVVTAINRLLSKIKIGAVAQQDLLANIAHQLRTPLAGLKAQIEWLQEKYANEVTTARSVGLMMLSTERMIRQTNQLLALARAEPTKFEKKRLEPLFLNTLVADCIHSFIAAADKKHIDLGFDLNPVRISGDAFLLRDLIENLIDNALHYTPEYGVVTVGTLIRDGAAIFYVEDNGPGIPEKERQLIFQRHYRIDQPASEKVTGNGIGLAIVSDIVKDHDASILITDTPGGGTHFSIIFKQCDD